MCELQMWGLELGIYLNCKSYKLISVISAIYLQIDNWELGSWIFDRVFSPLVDPNKKKLNCRIGLEYMALLGKA